MLTAAVKGNAHNLRGRSLGTSKDMPPIELPFFGPICTQILNHIAQHVLFARKPVVSTGLTESLCTPCQSSQPPSGGSPWALWGPWCGVVQATDASWSSVIMPPDILRHFP